MPTPSPARHRWGTVALVAILCASCTRATQRHEPTDQEPVARAVPSRTVRVTHNPLLSDGRDYTADPAPLVVDNQLYVLTGRDMARSNQNDFVMPEWQMLTTRGDPLNSTWTHYPKLLQPEGVFRWATPGRAYASQIVRGLDRQFYLYAPVIEAASTNKDKFAIGVAVASTPQGPWRDAHPGGPIVSQSVPVANSIQNIDPSVLIDDGRVYLYWGTFGKLKGIELATDMVTPIGTPIDVTTLSGFFEAPWLFKRGSTYYMAYAANTAGPASPCTEAVYYACIAYGTSSSPLGPWTYRGVILPPVSSTTSHPGIVEYRGAWWLVYHTADANGGGHFRRSVAIDRLTWNDATTPPGIRPIARTGAVPLVRRPGNNIASEAQLRASNEPVPVQYWLRALNDGKVRENPLPPDMWATWTSKNPAQQWVQYTWNAPVTINASSFHFWGDHGANSGIGVAPPSAWRLETCNADAWTPVQATSTYTALLNVQNRVTFAPVSTTCLRAVFDASTDGKTYAAVAGQEWTVEAAANGNPSRVSAQQQPGFGLVRGMQLVYASQGVESAPWIVDSLDAAARYGNASACSYIRFGQRDIRRTCVRGDTLFTWRDSTLTLTPARPLGPGMSVRLPAANGGTAVFETTDAEAVTISGVPVPVVKTLVTTFDATGNAVRRLRERFALSLGTATDGVFEARQPDGSWKVTQEFGLVRIVKP